MVLSSRVSRRIAAISADSARSGALSAPREALSAWPDGEGYLEVASAAWLFFPGMCWMSNLHGRVRCFKRNRRELVISSSVRSPNILTRGLWSVMTSKLSHPCVK